MENNEGEPDPRALAKAQLVMIDHLANIVELETFYKEVVANWSDIGHHDIGVLVYLPPISIETLMGYTKDAIIELDMACFRDSF